jgi:hypothetical protein
LLSPLFIFRFCWFPELGMFDTCLVVCVHPFPFWILLFPGLLCLWLSSFSVCS